MFVINTNLKKSMPLAERTSTTRETQQFIESMTVPVCSKVIQKILELVIGQRK